MTTSTLDPDNIPEPDRQLGKGHGTSALGPSDTSDTGSDVQSGIRLLREHDIGLAWGTNEDPDPMREDSTAGPDIGDSGLDSDSDAGGTGERASAGEDDEIELGQDIDVDHVFYVKDAVNSDSADEVPPRLRQTGHAEPPPEDD